MLVGANFAAKAQDSRLPCQWYMGKTLHQNNFKLYMDSNILIKYTEEFKERPHCLWYLILLLLSCPLWSLCSLGVQRCRYDRSLQIRFKELSSRYWTYWLMHLNKLSNIIGTKGGFTFNKIKFPWKLVWEGASFQSSSTTLSPGSELWLDVSDAIPP